MRSIVRRVVVMTLAGMIIAGFGERMWLLPSWQQQSDISSAAAAVIQALVSSSSADAAVSKKITAKRSSRLMLVPSKSKVKKKTASATGQLKSKRTKKGARIARSSSARGKRVGGRCEPQSLTYARQRSGIMRSRSGSENGPLTWFAAERRLGKTSAVPLPGSVLILGADRGHGMGTGHVAYVEDAYLSGPSTYRVVFSHTNYDRRCSLETNIEARYNSANMTLDIFSGAWQPWAKGLRVAGFIGE